MFNKIKKYIKQKITIVFFKYCYQESHLASYLVLYYLPCIMKDNTPVTGTYLFGIINEKIKDVENQTWWTPPAGTKRGEIKSIASVNLNVE